MTRSFVGAAALALCLVVSTASGYAQQPVDFGKQEYHSSCASCHGDDGKGAGPVAGFLKQKVPDLTVLAKNSGGVFPFARVYDVIDGREAVAVHGTRAMPVWGITYSEEGAKASGGYATPGELSSFARGRIIALIGYISTLQGK